MAPLLHQLSMPTVVDFYSALWPNFTPPLTNPSEARLKATRWYKEKFQGDADIKIQQFYRSAFDDVKLYEVIELVSKQALGEYEDLPVAL